MSPELPKTLDVSSIPLYLRNLQSRQPDHPFLKAFLSLFTSPLHIKRASLHTRHYDPSQSPASMENVLYFTAHLIIMCLEQDSVDLLDQLSEQDQINVGLDFGIVSCALLSRMNIYEDTVSIPDIDIIIVAPKSRRCSHSEIARWVEDILQLLQGRASLSMPQDVVHGTEAVVDRLETSLSSVGTDPSTGHLSDNEDVQQVTFEAGSDGTTEPMTIDAGCEKGEDNFEIPQIPDILIDEDEPENAAPGARDLVYQPVPSYTNNFRLSERCEDNAAPSDIHRPTNVGFLEHSEESHCIEVHYSSLEGMDGPFVGNEHADSYTTDHKIRLALPESSLSSSDNIDDDEGLYIGSENVVLAGEERCYRCLARSIDGCEFRIQSRAKSCNACVKRKHKCVLPVKSLDLLRRYGLTGPPRPQSASPLPGTMSAEEGDMQWAHSTASDSADPCFEEDWNQASNFRELRSRLETLRARFDSMIPTPAAVAPSSEVQNHVRASTQGEQSEPRDPGLQRALGHLRDASEKLNLFAALNREL